MAQKRMFDKAIIDTDKFMDLPMSSKALYFLLGMEADDEGFVSYKKVMRVHGGNEDELKILIAKKFLIAFESGVVVITDWNTNNYLDKNRIRETEYQNEKRNLVLTPKGKYELNSGLTSIVENSIEKHSKTEVLQSLPSPKKETIQRRPVDEFGTVKDSQDDPANIAFNFKTYISKLRSSPSEHEIILGLYWSQKKYDIKTLKHAQLQYGQDIKYAKALAGYPRKDIIAAFRSAKEDSEKNNYDWKISTVVKKITNINV